METASLLHAPLAPGLRPACAQGLFDALPYARRLQLERADPRARAASLAGLALALVAASRLYGSAFRGLADLRARADEKPRFERGPHFSISHTPSRVACVACASLDPGLDLESAPPEPERASMGRLLEWTATEATLKAAGASLRRIAAVRVDLNSRRSELDGRRYVLRELRLAPDTLGHLASPQPLSLDVETCALDDAEFSRALERVLGLSTQSPQ